MPAQKTSSFSRKKRSCAACTACCTYLRIDSRPGFSTRLDTGEDLAKSAGASCKYLTPKGCSIYEVRPALCRSFHCDWILGRKGYDNEPRPDFAGYLGAFGERFVMKEG